MSGLGKVKVVYTPEGGSRREWIFDPLAPPWDLASKTEVATGWPWATFRERLAEESALAYRAVLWALRQRTEPRLELESVEANYAELDFTIIDDLVAPEPEVASDLVAPEPEVGSDGQPKAKGKKKASEDADPEA